MIVAAVIWITAPITLLAVLWAIYSNNQMEVMQEEMWKLLDENEELKEQVRNEKVRDGVIRKQLDKEIEERMSA